MQLIFIFYGTDSYNYISYIAFIIFLAFSLEYICCTHTLL